MNWQKLLFMIIFFKTLSTFGGNSAGNGGDVLICDSNIQLLDYFEGSVLKGLSIDLGSKDLSVTKKVELVLDRLERLDQKRADKLRRWAKEFFSEVNFVSFDLNDISDSGYIWDVIQKPSYCEVEQIAIQLQPNSEWEPRYFISKRLWDSPNMTLDAKAGLVLHEIVYRDAIERGHINSIPTRNFTALISSKEIETIEVQAYRDALIKMDLMSYWGVSDISFELQWRIWHKVFPELELSSEEAQGFCEQKNPISTEYLEVQHTLPYKYNSYLPKRMPYVYELHQSPLKNYLKQITIEENWVWVLDAMKQVLASVLGAPIPGNPNDRIGVVCSVTEYL